MFSLLVFVVSPQRVRQTHSLQWMSEWLPLVSEVRRNRLRCSYTFSLQPLQSLSCFQFSFLLGFLSQNNQPPLTLYLPGRCLYLKPSALKQKHLRAHFFFILQHPDWWLALPPQKGGPGFDFLSVWSLFWRRAPVGYKADGWKNSHYL